MVSNLTDQVFEKNLSEHELKEEIMNFKNVTYLKDYFKENQCVHNKTYCYVIGSIICGVILKLYVCMLVLCHKKESTNTLTCISLIEITIFSLLLLSHFVLSMITFIIESDGPIGAVIGTLSIIQFMSQLGSDIIQLQCSIIC